MLKVNIEKGTLVFSYKNQYGYQEVIDNFEKSKNIYILTYNIHIDLLKKLYCLDKDTKLTIITNVPGTFKEYTTDDARKKAERMEQITKRILNVDKFSANVQVYFNLNNHAKIFIADDIAYIGSQNFSNISDEKPALEAGVIIRDPNKIEFIKTKFIDTALADYAFYDYKYDFSYLEPISTQICELQNLFKEMKSTNAINTFIKNIQEKFSGIFLILSSNKATTTKIINLFNEYAKVFYSKLYICSNNNLFISKPVYESIKGNSGFNYIECYNLTEEYLDNSEYYFTIEQPILESLEAASIILDVEIEYTLVHSQQYLNGVPTKQLLKLKGLKGY